VCVCVCVCYLLTYGPPDKSPIASDGRAVFYPITFKQRCTVARARLVCSATFAVIAACIAPYHADGPARRAASPRQTWNWVTFCDPATQ